MSYSSKLAILRPFVNELKDPSFEADQSKDCLPFRSSTAGMPKRKKSLNSFNSLYDMKSTSQRCNTDMANNVSPREGSASQ